MLFRSSIINALMCHFELSIESIEIAYLIEFERYFVQEIVELKTLQDLGLLKLDPQWITITPKGRLLIRNVCMVFDKYLRADQQSKRYSKVI